MARVKNIRRNSSVFGKVQTIKFYTRDLIRSQPNVLWVFGDNMQRVGFGGQAKAARGEPNAVGIPTKISPKQYFSDSDFNKAKPAIDSAYQKLFNHLHQGGLVMWPEDGVGSGLAKLAEKAPKIWHYIEQKTKELFNAEALSAGQSGNSTQTEPELSGPSRSVDADAITSFVGGYFFLSPFSDSPIQWEGETWRSAEHVYQATRVHNEQQLRAIRGLDDARKVRKMVEKWEKNQDISKVPDEISIRLMRDIQIAKFTQNVNLAERLARTAPALIVWTDDEAGDIWGVAKSGFGDNLLGNILEEIRDALISGELKPGLTATPVEDPSLAPITQFAGPFDFLSDDYPFSFQLEDKVFRSITEGLQDLAQQIAVRRAELTRDYSNYVERQAIAALAGGTSGRWTKETWEKPADDWNLSYTTLRNEFIRDAIKFKFGDPVFHRKLQEIGRRPIRVTDAASKVSIFYINQIRLSILGPFLSKMEVEKKPRSISKPVDWSKVSVRQVVNDIQEKEYGNANENKRANQALSSIGIMPPDPLDARRDKITATVVRDHIRALKQYREKVQLELEITARKPDPLDFYLNADEMPPDERLNEIESFSDEISRLNPRMPRAPRNARNARSARKSRSARKARGER